VPAHGPGHLATFAYTGLYRYFLTFCTDTRRVVFTAEEPFELVLEQILRAAASNGFAIHAYCFMPDHVHLLAEATDDSSDCLRFITRSKQLSGFYYRKRFSPPVAAIRIRARAADR
jgi:putative transposase